MRGRFLISDWGDETVLSWRIRDDAPYLGLRVGLSWLKGARRGKIE